MSQAKAEFSQFKADVLRKLEALGSDYSKFVAERIKIHLDWYETLMHEAKTEKKRQGLLEELTSTNIFASMTTSLPLYWYDEVFQLSTDFNLS